MILRLKPIAHNIFPVGGFLIRETDPKQWLLELQELNFELNQVSIFPIPGHQPNSIWGCLVEVHSYQEPFDFGRNETCQRVYPNLFIPEKAKLLPTVLPKDYERLFSEQKHIFHPDFGLVELDESFDFLSIITAPREQSVYTFKPADPVFIPQKINSFEVKEIKTEDPLEEMAKKIAPESKDLKDLDKPLTKIEKGKLSLYKSLFRKEKNKDGSFGGTRKTNFLSRLQGLFGRRSGGMLDRMQADFENLEERNQQELDKLMDLLKNNPDEALKYAIPLDDNGSSRGPDLSRFTMSKRWGNFSLFGNLSSRNNSGQGGSVDLGQSNYDRLNQQYNETARQLIEKKEYEKAAFVYLKLLKDYRLAASTLEQGGFYQQAAHIYLKYCNDKVKAAEAFEKGKFIHEAIELYTELRENEKVGDLYAKLNKRKKADEFYQLAVDTYVNNNNHLKGAEIYRNKMMADAKAQELLRAGWEDSPKKRECLTAFFDFITEPDRANKEIKRIYKQNVNETNRSEFLKVVHHQFKKPDNHNAELREMAYQLISKLAEKKPVMVDELKKFNQDDPEIVSDTFRFRYRRSNNRK